MNIRENVASLFIFLLVLQLVNISNAAVGPCIYDVNPKGIIDLTSVGRTDGIPKWKDQNPDVSDDHVYSYNPCHPFDQGECKNVAGCQAYATNPALTYTLGPQTSFEWLSNGDDPPAITYDSGERKLHVNMICLQGGEPDSLKVHGYDETTRVYIMILSSKCVCWDGCKGGRPSNPTGNGLGGGAIVIILLVVLIFVYLVAFMIFNKFKRQATGLDILPHRSFWVSLPGLALGGLKFIFQKVTGKSGYNTVT